GTTVTKKPCGSLLPSQKSIFNNTGLLDIFTDCWIPGNANELPALDGAFTTYVGELHEGIVIALPFDSGELFVDSRTQIKSFYSSGKRLPFEHVSLVSKGKVRKLVSRSLEYLHHKRGLPYIHKWYFPNQADSVFAFRIDTDYSNKNEIHKLYKCSLEHTIPFTWFVDTKSQQQFIEIYSRMREQEIALHCFEHETFQDYEQNKNNIRSALDLLRNVKLFPAGFAAPYGKWNDNLAKAIADYGFGYSSEFSYDYDDLPSFPLLHENPINVLQIPIHPISIGTLKRLGYTDDMMKKYFSHVIHEKLALHEPLILYHHPKDGHENVLCEIFQSVKQHQLPSVRFGEYASWWKQRAAAKIDIHFATDTLTIQQSNVETSVYLHITTENGFEAFHSITKQLPLKELSWQNIPPSHDIPKNIARIRKCNPWITIIKVQDKTIGRLKNFSKW
ncbi:MAG: hypothetical protein EPO24_15185, partial [Bacteroidetes bacterium]